jgi:hypothetical protein
MSPAWLTLHAEVLFDDLGGEPAQRSHATQCRGSQVTWKRSRLLSATLERRRLAVGGRSNGGRKRQA